MFKRIKKLSNFCIPALMISAVGFGYSYFLTSSARASNPYSGLAEKTQSRSSAAQATLVSSGSNAADDKTLRQLTTELRSLEQQLQSQLQQNAQLVLQINNLSELSTDQEVENEITCAEDMEDELLSAEDMEKEKALITLQTELFDNTLWEESVDTEQIQKLTAEIDDLLEGESISGSTLVNVECGVSLCRVALQHKDVNAQNDFINISQILLEMRSDSFIDLVDYGDGTTGTALYLSRDGFSLPHREQLEEG